MNIGPASVQSGVPAKMIRYYESIGLVPPPVRSGAGYRVYSNTNVRILQFVHRARSLGFSLKEISNLLALWQNKNRASARVKAIAARHLEDIDQRISELESIRATLVHLVEHCHGDHRPDCPILDDLAAAPPSGRRSVDKVPSAVSRKRQSEIRSLRKHGAVERRLGH